MGEVGRNHKHKVRYGRGMHQIVTGSMRKHVPSTRDAGQMGTRHTLEAECSSPLLSTCPRVRASLWL